MRAPYLLNGNNQSKLIDNIVITKGLHKDNWAEFTIKLDKNATPVKIRLIIDDISISAQQAKDLIFGSYFQHKAAYKLQKSFRNYHAKADLIQARNKYLIGRKERAIISQVCDHVSSLFRYSCSAELANGSINKQEAKKYTEHMRQGEHGAHLYKKSGNCGECASTLLVALKNHPELKHLKFAMYKGSLIDEDHEFVVIAILDANNNLKEGLILDVWFKFNDLPADKAFRSSPVKNGQRESGIMASQTDFFKIMESCEDDMFLYKGYRRRIELNTLRVEAENEIDRHYQKVTFENNNPLIKAVRDRNLEDVKCFLHKELVNVQDYAGDTLLHIAADYGHVDIIYLLLENGYSCSITNNYSYTPLMLAIKNNHNKAAEILIQKSQISQTADNGDTLLHLAARYGNAHTVRILIEKYGFNLKDINSVNNSQQTPLYLACQKGEVEAIKILFKYNADLFIKDNKGKSPLHIAFKRGHEEVILLLTKLILASELLTNQQKITLLQAENKSGCSGFMQTISRCNYTVALSFMALIRNSALSTHEQLQIFQLKNEQEVTLLDKILGEYKEYNSKEAKLQRKEEQKQIYSSKNQEAIRKMQDSPDFNNTKEPLNTMLKILSQLKLDAKLALKVSSMRTISGISRMISLFNKKQEGIITATLNTIHMSPVNQAIKDSLYCAKDLYGAPYLYMALQTSGLDKVKKYLKHIKNYVSIESLNNFMVLDIAKVGSIIHGLLIAVANDPKVLDIFLSELENATAYGLFKEVYDSQMPIVQQRKPISESSLEILKYKSSDEFWNKMEDTLKLLKEKIFQLLFKILVLSS